MYFMIFIKGRYPYNYDYMNSSIIYAFYTQKYIVDPLMQLARKADVV
jgi:hypothetical protein